MSRSQLPAKIFRFQRAPNATDDVARGWALGAQWLDESEDTPVLYVCTSAAAGNAVWQGPSASEESHVKAVSVGLNFNSPSPLVIFTPEPYARIASISVIVGRPFAADASITVTDGVTWLAATEVDLQTVGVYEKTLGIDAGYTPDQVVLSYTRGSSVDGFAKVTIAYVTAS